MEPHYATNIWKGALAPFVPLQVHPWNAAIELNSTGWCDITYFIKRANRKPTSKSFFLLRSNLPHYFNVNSKTNHLTIVDLTNYQSKCQYKLVHSTR